MKLLNIACYSNASLHLLIIVSICHTRWMTKQIVFIVHIPKKRKIKSENKKLVIFVVKKPLHHNHFTAIIGVILHFASTLALFCLSNPLSRKAF